MKIALIHLSDIHLKEQPEANPILRRAEAIAKAVASVSFGVNYGLIVVSGGTAFSGKEGEYRHGAQLLESLRSTLAAHFTGAQIELMTVAGNHDCDFCLANSVREILISSLRPEKIDDAVITQLVHPQQHYQAFARGFHTHSQASPESSLHSLYRSSSISLADKTILFHLLNSAWISQLREKPGTLYFPVGLIKDRIAEAPHADLVVSVIHHPFNWFSPENGRDIR